MNNRHAQSKLGKIERYLNRAIILIFFAQVTFVSFSVGSIYILGYNTLSKLPYIYPTNDSGSILPLWLSNW